MARTRTGTSGEGIERDASLDAVDPTDRTPAADVGIVSDPIPERKPLAAGHLRVNMLGRRNNPAGGEMLPPGEYDLPAEEAKAYIRVGVAKLVV